jgi:hypothetical protein
MARVMVAMGWKVKTIMKMEQTECSEMSAFEIQTPDNYLEENIR